MGLNDIKLSPSVVTALYKSVLVQDPGMDKTLIKETHLEIVSEEAPEPPPPPEKKGKSKKEVPGTPEQTIITESVTIIVEEDDPYEVPAHKRKTTEKSIRSLGGNQKNILIVVKYGNVKYLPDEDLEFLTNILKACKLSLDDVAIVNTNNNPGDGYKEYLKNWNSKIVLLFGVDPVSFDLPVNFPEFQVQSVTNTKFLYTPSLNECRTDKLLKSKLWVSLQRIFGL